MTTHAPKQQPPSRNRREVPAIVVGAVLALVALAALVAGGLGVAAHTTQRDDDGQYRTAAAQLSTPTHVLVADDIGVGKGSKWLFHKGRLGTVRITATGTGDDPIFV